MPIDQTELAYRNWRSDPDFPDLNDTHSPRAKVFVQRILEGHDFEKQLYPHQAEALLRVIHAGEKLGKWETLLDIVTGGGKTAIMAAIIAYLWQVRQYRHFLIITPNTIVRERVGDAFDQNSPEYTYNDFPFFFNSYQDVPQRLVSKVLRKTSDANAVRDANIIVTNIHQLYENQQSRALEILLSEGFTDKLVVLNDEAHNAAANQYREVLKLLRDRTVARVDLTATPYRLDKQELDTAPPVYVYQVSEAIQDRTVKQIVATKPDIKSVKMTYDELNEEGEVVKRVDVKEMPWEEIESELRRGGAVRFVTSKNARRQQLQIGQACVKYQEKQIPRDEFNDLSWTPLWMVVALSQKDALGIFEALQKKPFNYKQEEVLLVHNRQPEENNKKAFLLGRKSSDGLNAEDRGLWNDAQKIKVVIGVSMLREGWDVRNISVISLFRKFSYTTYGDQTHTVYGPQIIGRGLRRIRRGKNEQDHLFVVDHPAFNHDWLWELLSADVYGKPLNPGDEIDAEELEKIEIPEKEADEENETDPNSDTDNDFNIEDVIADLPEIPEIQPVEDWKKHFSELKLSNRRLRDAVQNITNVTSRLVGTDMTVHETPDPEINKGKLNVSEEEEIEKKTEKELVEYIVKEISAEPRHTLRLTFGQETSQRLALLHAALNWIFKEKFGVDINDLEKTERKKLEEIIFKMPQIIEEFRKPEIVLSIVGDVV